MDVLQWDAVGLELQSTPEDREPNEIFYADCQILFQNHGRTRLSVQELLPRRHITVENVISEMADNVKYCSLNECLFVLKSPKNLDILSLKESAITHTQHIVFDATSSETILGVEPTFVGEFILIKSSGIDLYIKQKSTFVLKKSIGVPIHWYHYSNNSRTLLISSKKTNVFPLFHIQAGAVCQTLSPVKLDVKTSDGSNSGSAPIDKRHFQLFEIRNEVVVGVLDEQTRTIPQLILYKITKKTTALESTLTLSKPGNFIFIQLSNLILAINTLEDVFELFDVKAPPRPIYAAPWHPPVKEDNWHFISPHFLHSPSTNSIFSLSLSIPDLVKLAPSTSVLGQVLVQRPNSKEHVLICLLEMIKKSAPTKEVYRAFKIVNSSKFGKPMSRRMHSYESLATISSGEDSYGGRSASAMSDSASLPKLQYVGSIYGFSRPFASTYHESSILSQEEILALVFLPLLESTTPSNHRLGQYVFEYIKSLAELQQSPNAFLSEFVAQLYYDSGRIGELTMLLQHGLLQESVMLAKIILKNANNDSQFFQLGLDILKRLHEDEEVILELQSRKLLLESLRYATQFNCIHFISPSKILEDSYRSGNKTLFLNVYKWLEELGLIPIDFEQPRSTNGDMMRYISIFREIWGEVVDMEPVNLFE